MKSTMKFWIIAAVITIPMGCSKHNPDHVLNPESALYAGDSLANLDSDGNGIADFIENQPECPVGDLECGASQALSSQIQLLSSSSLAALSSSLIGSSSSGTVSSSTISSSGTSSEDQSSSAVSSVAQSSSTPSSSATSSTTQSSSGNFVGDTLLIDERDQARYSTKKIGSLVWMRTNLYWEPSGVAPCADIQVEVINQWSSTTTATASEETAVCKASGRYYAINQARSACPAGWRLPTTDEYRDQWENLELDSTFVRRSSGTFDVSNTGFYWTSDPGSSTADQNYCQNNCGIAWIFHNGGDPAQQYSQKNDGTEGLVVRCVRERP